MEQLELDFEEENFVNEYDKENIIPFQYEIYIQKEINEQYKKNGLGKVNCNRIYLINIVDEENNNDNL